MGRSCGAPDVTHNRYILPPYDPPVPYLLRLSRGEIDAHMLAAAASRSQQWYQLGPRIEVVPLALPRPVWDEDRLKFSVEFKGKRVLLFEPYKDSILELSPIIPPSDDFFLRYFTEVGSGWCCNAPGSVKVEADDPSSYIFTPTLETLEAGEGEVSSIIERQLGVLAGDSEATRQWLDIVTEESTLPGCEDVPADLQDRLEGEVWLRDSTISCGFTDESGLGSAHLLFPRCLGDKLFVGAALFSQQMLALHAQLDRDAEPVLQWQGKAPIDLTVNDATNCLLIRWRLVGDRAYFPVPNPSFGYADIAYTGMGARLDAWWEECQQGPAAAHEMQGSGSERTVPPPRLRYAFHRLENAPIADCHYRRGHPRHLTDQELMRSGKDYRYRETSAPGMVGYEDVAYYPPLWLARCAYAAAVLASAPSAALAQRLAVLREEIMSRFGTPVPPPGEDDDMLDEDDMPWPPESVGDYPLLLALMPRFHDFSQAPQRVWLPMQLVTPEDDGWDSY